MTHIYRALALLMLLPLLACKGSSTAKPGPQSVDGPSDKAAGPGGRVGATSTYDVGGVALGDGLFVGPGRSYDNLTVFPILAKTQTDVGPVVSLHDALHQGDAEVRELGDGGQGAHNQDGRVQQQGSLNGDGIQQQAVGGGAQVGKLAIENKGDVPVYVLAGTIVKGGKQDRQIGQDFIIGGKSTVPIDAFCVEHGRWNESRGGKSTGGKFTAVKQLANTDVRVAGQYKSDQNEVWSKVSAVNKANKKHSDSDSLLATADDATLKRERDALRRRILRDLDAVKPKGAVVGYAYAVGGEVHGVRWFAHHRVFSLFREVLVNTAIVDAITARASGAPKQAGAASAPLVAKFIRDARTQASAAEVRETSGKNQNEYAESKDAYQSTTTFEFDADAAAKPKATGKHGRKKKVKMSVDFVKKK